MVNKERVQEVIDALVKDTGKRFHMSDWGIEIETGFHPKKPMECGTAFCVAGWTNAIDYMKHPDEYNKNRDYFNIISDSENAQHLLGLEAGEALDLFMLKRNGLSLFHAMSEFDAQDDDKKRIAGIEVLTNLRDHGVVDWPAALAKAGIEPTRHYDEDEDDYND